MGKIVCRSRGLLGMFLLFGCSIFLFKKFFFFFCYLIIFSPQLMWQLSKEWFFNFDDFYLSICSFSDLVKLGCFKLLFFHENGKDHQGYKLRSWSLGGGPFSQMVSWLLWQWKSPFFAFLDSVKSGHVFGWGLQWEGVSEAGCLVVEYGGVCWP